MAGRKRKSQPAPNNTRTLERVAIAALAAIAARGSGESLALSAVAIFAIVVIIEELGRRWIWYGKSVTLRDVALSTIGDIRLQRARALARRKRSRRRARLRPRGSAPAVGARDKARRTVQK